MTPQDWRDQQAAVLAVVEQLGEPTLPEITSEFGTRDPMEVLKVLRALEGRGLVKVEGYGVLRFSSGNGPRRLR